MKPIPAPSTRESGTAEPIPATASELIKSAPGSYSNANRRSSQPNTQQAYPWLLAASTAIAVVMGWMYITKPVVVQGEPIEASSGNIAGQTHVTSKPGLLPNREHLPGNDKSATQSPPAAANADVAASAPIHSHFEETNMRVQHILSATSEDGHVSRIDLEVPVLYQSRKLRWSPAEVARASDLLIALMDYQEKSHQLRTHGQQLLADWNGLIGRSIPSSKLRADSPSLPENQEIAIANSGPVDTTTRDAIEIQTKETP